MWVVAFVVPYVAVFLTFVAYPVVYGLWMGSESRLYRGLFADPIYQSTVVNTVLYLALGVNVKMFLALLLSGFFMRPGWWMKVLLLIFVLPWAVPSISTFISIHWMLNGEWGILNAKEGGGRPENSMFSGTGTNICVGSLTARIVSGTLEPMPSAYFDTNVYGCVRAEAVEALRAALAGREIVTRLSPTDIDELLGDWETNRSAAVGRLQVARDLVGFGDMLKQPRDLLGDAIGAYAAGKPPPSPTLPQDQQEVIADCLHRVVRGDTSVDQVVRQIVEGVRALKDEFCRDMVGASARARAEWELIDADRRRTVTFEAYWAAGAAQWAEDFADHVGLAAACRERGLDGLLDVRTVRFCVGAVMSWIFSVVVRDQPRRPQRQDGYDLWHALQASAADVFVTRDERLAGLLGRVPLDGFRVAASLGALLAA